VVRQVFKLDRGLAIHKITDHYAILGVPLTLDPEQIRQKYLQLAMFLHPDIARPDPSETDLAEEYLAKLVNPAYKILYSDRDRKEYLATLRLIGQKLRQESEKPELQCELAKKLLKYPHETTYVKYFEETAAKQYDSLDNILQCAADLSEINLAYLATSELVFAPAYAPKPEEFVAAKVSPANRNLQMAEVFINKKQWGDALKELKNGEKLDPNNAAVYAQLGLVYMNQNVSLMAKNSFQKALKLDPKEPTALKYISQVETQAKPPAKKEEKKGGLFGWGKK
jgi:curved DNA-binding protein CbpA